MEDRPVLQRISFCLRLVRNNKNSIGVSIIPTTISSAESTINSEKRLNNSNTTAAWSLYNKDARKNVRRKEIAGGAYSVITLKSYFVTTE
jgi:hypothetical protein